MKNQGQRPHPDESKEYREHQRHTSNCKWCHWDRTFQIECLRKETEAELKQSAKKLGKEYSQYNKVIYGDKGKGK